MCSARNRSALTAAEATKLIAARDKAGVVVQEAFMIRSHPQWKTALGWVEAGRIGRVLTVSTLFSYFNRDPGNVRNMADIGGGALYDIGCYAILAARLAFGRDPARVAAVIDRDPDFGTDRLVSALLDFGGGAATLSVSTQAVPYQRVQILGETGRVEIVIPFNAPIDATVRVFLDDGSELGDASALEETIAPVDQYALEIEDFGRAARGEAPQPMTLEDSVANMAVIDAVFRAGETADWAMIERP